MKVVFRNSQIPKEPISKNYYYCLECKKEFLWSDGCMSRIKIVDKIHDEYECLCSKCAKKLTNDR